MRHRIIHTILAICILAIPMQSCIKDLDKEGIYTTTQCHGLLQDIETASPVPNIKVVVTDGTTIQQTTYSASDGSFSIDISVEQLRKGQYLAVQPDSLYDSQTINLDNLTLGAQTFDLGIIRIKGPSLPTVFTYEPSEITANSAHCFGSLGTTGNSAIIECGFVYDIYQYPTTESNKILATPGEGDMFDAYITLQPNTTYYLRSFARNNLGTAYGEQITLTTLNGLAEISETEITQVTATSANCTSDIIYDGGFPIVESGICYSTTPNPTTQNLRISQSDPGSHIECSLTGLLPNTHYYVRAYASNTAGTAYSSQTEFTTLSGLPTVSTTQASNITNQSAQTGGNITDNGGFPVLQRGVCFSTTPLPTIASGHTTDGSGSGTFTSQLFNLTPSTTYYYRAYATNVAGTAYGEQYIFVTQ